MHQLPLAKEHLVDPSVNLGLHRHRVKRRRVAQTVEIDRHRALRDLDYVDGHGAIVGTRRIRACRRGGLWLISGVIPPSSQYSQSGEKRETCPL